MRPTAVAWPGVVAAGIATAVVVPYAFLLDGNGEGADGRARILFVTVSLAGGAVAALLGSFTREAGLRPLLLGAAGGVLLLWGCLAAFSIGAPLVLAGVLALVGGNRAAADRRAEAGWLAAVALGAALAVVGVLATGDELG